MNTYGKTSITLASLVLPVSLAAGGLVAWHLKSTNPDQVDITLGLAYLRPILITSLTTYTIMWLAGLVSALVGLRKDSSSELSKLGLVLLVVVAIASIVNGSLNKATDRAVDSYRSDHASSQTR